MYEIFPILRDASDAVFRALQKLYETRYSLRDT